MDTSPQRLNLGEHLKAYYDFFQLSGLSNFNFNWSTRRVELSKTRSRISRTVLELLSLICGARLVLIAFSLVYVNVVPGSHDWRTVAAQENLLMQISFLTGYIGVFLVARSYLTLTHTIIPATNEMFAIFELLEKQSDSTIFFLSTFGIALILKISLCLTRILSSVVTVFAYSNITGPYNEVLLILTYMGHLYSQLVLACFYMKMNKILQIASFEMNKRSLTRNVRKLLVIAFRINRLRRILNKFFSALFLSGYLGLFGDIFHLYYSLKIVLYNKFSDRRLTKIVQFIYISNWRLPFMLIMSYDVYLIGHLWDMLGHLERTFERKILLLVCRNKLLRNPSVESEIDQLMIRRNICDLNFDTCRVIEMDQRFFFNILINAIFINVINFLQFYAGDIVYNKGNDVTNDTYLFVNRSYFS